MNIYKKCMIVTIIVITLIILSQLWMVRHEIKKSMRENMEDGVVSDEQKNEVNSLINNAVVQSMGNYKISDLDLPLKQYCIKASCNSAKSGIYMNLDMISHLLERGCRFLDFEIYSFDGKPYVAYSTDSENMNMDSKNKLPLSSVLQRINRDAFHEPTPNTEDPLFIHFSIRTNNTSVYEKIATSVHVNLKKYLYKKEVTPNTLLSEIMGKYVLIIDKSTSPNYMNYPECNGSPCYNLKEYLNMESGTDSVRNDTESFIMNIRKDPPYITDDNVKTDVEKLRIISPNNITLLVSNNPKSYSLIRDYGAQIICYDYTHADSHLQHYENIFYEHNSAFVPLSKCLKYIEENTK